MIACSKQQQAGREKPSTCVPYKSEFALTYDSQQEENMQSVQRSIMLLRPGDGPSPTPQSRGTLKLQALPTGLAVLLTTTGLKPDNYALYLFLQDGAAIYAGDVTSAGLRRMLPGIRLNNVAGAAVIHSASLSFCLKSINMDWTEAQPRFKMLHAPRPAQPAQPQPEPQAPPAAVPAAQPPGAPEAAPPADAATDEPPAEQKDETPANAAPPEEPQQGNILVENAVSENPGNVSAEGPPTENSDGYMPDATCSPENRTPEDSRTETAPCDNCPYAPRQQCINPFPTIFPNSEWTRMSYPGPAGWWHYITGRIYTDSGTVVKAVGVPGEYGMMPPVWLEGFGTYLRCNSPDAHGYWLMFQDAETGEILDMGLSPRGA